jgi:hypothetical protein
MWFYDVKKTFLERLPHDADLLSATRDCFARHNMRMGAFMAIGAVKRARISFYDQAKKVYGEEAIDQPAEILSCIGNISELDGEVFAHAHVVLSLADGTTRGGHLLEGTPVFAGELFGFALDGEQLQRAYDPVTGLKLWKLPE